MEINIPWNIETLSCQKTTRLLQIKKTPIKVRKIQMLCSRGRDLKLIKLRDNSHYEVASGKINML